MVPDRGHVMRDSGLGARGRAGDPRRRLRRDIPGPGPAGDRAGRPADRRADDGRTRRPIREPPGPGVPAAAQLTPGCPGGRSRQPGPGLRDLSGDKTRARGTDDPGLVPRRQRGDPRQLPRPRRHRRPLAPPRRGLLRPTSSGAQGRVLSRLTPSAIPQRSDSTASDRRIPATAWPPASAATWPSTRDCLPGDAGLQIHIPGTLHPRSQRWSRTPDDDVAPAGVSSPCRGTSRRMIRV